MLFGSFSRDEDYRRKTKIVGEDEACRRKTKTVEGRRRLSEEDEDRRRKTKTVGGRRRLPDFFMQIVLLTHQAQDRHCIP